MPPRKKKLSVVPDGAPPPPDPRKQTVKGAADISERDLLVALRSRIAGEIDRGVPAHALAPLARQLREIAKEIERIDAVTDQEATEDAEVADEAFDPEAL